MKKLHPAVAFPCVAVMIVACGCEPGSPPSDAAPAPVATVVTVVSSTGQVEETLRTLGRVELDPKRTRTVTFASSGQVRRVLVTPGQELTLGTELLTLGPLPPDSLEVRQARIELEYARRELERLQRMRNGQLATNEQVQQAEKALSSAQAVVDDTGGQDTGGQDTGGESSGGSAAGDDGRITRAPVLRGRS